MKEETQPSAPYASQQQPAAGRGLPHIFRLLDEVVLVHRALHHLLHCDRDVAERAAPDHLPTHTHSVEKNR